MYKKFYGLTRSPFEISPDPYFLFPTARHNEALASIIYGVVRRKGFIVVTGEVGTGKTLLVRCLLELMHRQDIASANVFNPGLSPLEFLRYVAGDLGLRLANQDKGTLLLELNNFLIARYQRGLTTVLIVDEAQHLEAELLEEIRRPGYLHVSLYPASGGSDFGGVYFGSEAQMSQIKDWNIAGK